MRESKQRSLIAGLAGGAGAAACVALLMGQAGTQPTQRGGDYFVTGEGNHAYLWQRDGNNLRFVSQAETMRPGRENKPDHDRERRPMDPSKPTEPHKPGDPK